MTSLAVPPEPLSVIYGLHLVDAPQIRYVGLTTRGTRWRLQRHREESRRQRGKDRVLYRWVRAHGEKAVRIVTLEPVDNPELLREREIHWITYLNTYAGDRLGGLNTTLGGDGTWGYRHTPEARAAITAAQRGRTYPERVARTIAVRQDALLQRCRDRGHERDEVTSTDSRSYCRECQRLTRLGKTSWNAGRPWSTESRHRMSEASIGQVAWNRGRKATPAEVERNRLAQHTYWHVGRDVRKSGCSLCEASTPVSLPVPAHCAR